MKSYLVIFIVVFISCKVSEPVIKSTVLNRTTVVPAPKVTMTNQQQTDAIVLVTGGQIDIESRLAKIESTSIYPDLVNIFKILPDGTLTFKDTITIGGLIATTVIVRGLPPLSKINTINIDRVAKQAIKNRSNIGGSGQQ